MHTLHLARLLTLMVASVVTVGCGSLPFVSQPTRAPQPATTVVAVATPTLTPMPTATVLPASPTPVVTLPTVPAAPTVAPTLSALPNLAAVKLTAKDLPSGFQEVAADARSAMNLTDYALNAMFGKIGAQARVQNLMVLQHPQRAQVIAMFLLYPLASEEKITLETQLANADNALKAWGNALVGESGVKDAKPLAGADKFGDKSIGFTTTTQMLGVNIRADAVMMVRGSVAQVVMSFCPEPVPPAINAIDLAKLYDARLASALTGK
ncbi:MAG: hypothetical protein N2559_03100 [Anaerolineae bacterium]|nr:hypothetical protein [Anaerolineae bacterium]